MKKKNVILGLTVIVCLAASLAVHPANAQTANPDDEKAAAAVNRMAEFLAQAKSLSVKLDIGFDVVQDSGQKIEFGETREIVLQRPDQLRIVETKRSGGKSQITFDGNTMALYLARENVYAEEIRPGTVDETIEYFVDSATLRIPLVEMFSSHLSDTLTANTNEITYVEESLISGVPCDHLALRGDGVDIQIWVAQGSKPLPQRVVITYRKEDGRPQFWANFSQWDLEPEIEDSLFVFDPPEGAKKIAFSPKQITQN